MMTFGLVVAVTLALALVQGAAIGNPDEHLTAKSSSVDNSVPVVSQSQFSKCKLKPNPKVHDLITHRLCIKQISEKEGSTQVGGRLRRSVDDKLRQLAKFDDVLFVNQASDKLRLPRSLEALCAGDLGHYSHEVREYIQWRCKHGYGQLMRRWGRSAAAGSPSVSGSHHLQIENEVLDGNANGIDYFGGEDDDEAAVKRYKMSYKERAKRDEADDMRAIVEAYREWRSQNGYGQTSGRWG